MLRLPISSKLTGNFALSYNNKATKMMILATPQQLQQKKFFMNWIFGSKNNNNNNNNTVPSSPSSAPSGPTAFTPQTAVEFERTELSPEQLESAKKFDHLNAPQDMPSLKPTRPPTAHALCQVAAEGDLDQVKDLMRRGAPANIAPNSSGLTALHTACAGGHVEVVEYILSQARMSPIACASRENITPLHIACLSDKPEVVEFLCKRIRDTKVQGPKLHDGRVMDPIDIRANDERVTPLHLAVKFASKPVVEILLKYGANPIIFSREEEPQSPISVSCVRGDLELLKVLFLAAIKLPGMSERQVVELASPISGTTPLQIAAGAGHKHVVQFLVEECDANPRYVNELCPHPAIYLAAYEGHADVVRYFLESPRCGPIKPDECQVTEGVSPLHAACRSGSVETVKVLLEKGADRFLARKDTGIVPLHLACLHGHLDIVKLIVPVQSKLPKLPLAEAKGYTCLHLALIGKHNDVLEYLFQIGFAPELSARADERRILPLHIACETGNARAIKLIVEHAEESKLKEVLNARDVTGGTPLHAACFSGNLEAVEFLVRAGADMGISDKTGSTPMLVAKENKHQHLIEFMQRYAKATTGHIPGEV